LKKIEICYRRQQQTEQEEKKSSSASLKDLLFGDDIDNDNNNNNNNNNDNDATTKKSGLFRKLDVDSQFDRVETNVVGKSNYSQYLKPDNTSFINDSTAIRKLLNRNNDNDNGDDKASGVDATLLQTDVDEIALFDSELQSSSAKHLNSSISKSNNASDVPGSLGTFKVILEDVPKSATDEQITIAMTMDFSRNTIQICFIYFLYICIMIFVSFV
jgi:hypothetical protein